MQQTDRDHSEVDGLDESVIDGSVTEIIDGGRYTYLCVNSDTESQWVATNAAELNVGDTIRFQPGLVMRDFRSSLLGRTFPAILFVDNVEILDRAPVSVQRREGLPSGHPLVPESTRSAVSSERLPSPGSLKAPKGIVLIAELERQQDRLSGSAVAVLGMVSKINLNIMEQNWIHLMDERGQEVVVTSSEMPPVGEIVIAQGRLVIGKTLRGGYFFPMLLEGGTFSNPSEQLTY